MAYRRVRLPQQTKEAVDWASLRAELGIVESFSPAALAQADAATPQFRDRLDLTQLPFFTLDPAGSMDLDQAMHLSQTEDGFVVRYAIADVAAFVHPHTELDDETQVRGETLYCPDTKVPLHPHVIGEDRASLLPNQQRAAVVWTLVLDTNAQLQTADVTRADITSVAKLDYKSAQSALDAGPHGTSSLGAAGEQLRVLQTIGECRAKRAQERGALDFHIPEQVVALDEAGNPTLTYRASTPCENWNSEISLLTNLAAARIMVEARVGLLRVLPPVKDADVESLRRSADALGVTFPENVRLSDWLIDLDPTNPRHAAVLNLGARLLRGATYVAFDGQLPANIMHSAVAAPYAHATAPIRRLADRYVAEICLAVQNDHEIPAWVRETLPKLPQRMAQADQRAHTLERITVDLAEAVVMSAHIGEQFVAVVVDVNAKASALQIAEPAVVGHVDDVTLELGSTVSVRVDAVDIAQRAVTLSIIR